MEAIFFDLYETLVTHFDPDWKPPPLSIAWRLGLEDHVFGARWSEFDAAWQLGEVSSYTEALIQLCAASGIEPPETVLDELSREYREMTARVFEQIETEIIEMVTALKERGFKLGVITNASNLDAAPWPGCALAPYFDDFVASYEVGLLKRDVRIFELACRRIDVQPDAAAFVGDGGGNELQGAVEAGLTAYWSSWFLDRWPQGIRPNGFPGDDWRQYETGAPPPFERLEAPRDLMRTIAQCP